MANEGGIKAMDGINLWKNFVHFCSFKAIGPPAFPPHFQSAMIGRPSHAVRFFGHLLALNGTVGQKRGQTAATKKRRKRGKAN
jgi:hypothetical protein